MKANLDNSGAKPSLSQRSRGAALVLVLAFLVLITALVISFFTSVTTELGGAKQYAGGANAKQLADSAVQAVIGTLKLATSGTADDGSPAAWASQPGMIRTYNNRGNPLSYYKLYSSGSMKVTTPTGFDPASDTDDNWSTKPALYTDLNSPVVSGTATYFPIIDGNGLFNGANLNPAVPFTKPIASKTYLTYDANKDGVADVEGFYVEQPATYDSTKDASSVNNPVPMPTRWIYVLRDGTLVAPDDGSNTTATFGNTPADKRPSLSNPITGRIAYWTDDDTCKVNINTATVGTYWDTPRVNSTEEKKYGLNQPMTNEFQRYPGHPATTSLRPIFSSLWKGNDARLVNESIYQIIPRITGGGSEGGAVLTTATSGGVPAISLDKDRLYASIDELMFNPVLGSSGTSRNTQGLTKTQLEQSRFFITANNRAPDVNLFNKPRVCIWPVSDINDTSHRTAFDNVFAFCSTSGSGNAYYFRRSDSDHSTVDLPDTVVSPQYPTPLERNRMLLDYLHYLTSQPIPGFSGGVNGFQGKYHTTGTGTGTDCDQILTEIFDYIRCANLNDKNLALVAGSTAKPFAATGQVVPIKDRKTSTRGFGRFPTIDKAFFHFIGNSQNPLPPPTIDKAKTVLGVTGTITNALPIAVAPTLSAMNPYDVDSNQSGIVYGKIRVHAGFFVNVFTPSHGFIFTQYPKFGVEIRGLDSIWWGPEYQQSGTMELPKGSGTTTIARKVIPVSRRFSAVTSGSFSPSGAYRIMTLNGKAIGPDQSYMYPFQGFAGGNMGYSSLVVGQGWTGSYSPPTYRPYPFVTSSQTVTDPDNGNVETNDLDVEGKLRFSGGTITFKIWNAGGDEVVQTGTLNFPASTNNLGWPVPKLAPTSPKDGEKSDFYDATGNFRYFVTGSTTLATSATSGTTTFGYNGSIGFGGRLSSGVNGYGNNLPNWIIDTDVVRSVEVASGDPRLAAALANVPASLYSAHKKYSDDTAQMAHSLRTAVGYPYYGATYGRLVNVDLAYPASKAAIAEGSNGSKSYGANAKGRGGYAMTRQAWDWGIPLQAYPQTGSGVLVGGSGTVPGDWDNGFGNMPDGPYISKADEGDTRERAASSTSWSGSGPYFENMVTSYGTQATMFSPNRQIPSAGTFGSLPTGVFANQPWQTLLFRPLPIGHPGLGVSMTSGSSDVGAPYTTPPDHLLLDLFNMPVVEPYPISEPLSTAGRVNMNYQIAPFTYINRDTGIRAVLDAEKVMAVANTMSKTYKGGSASSVRFSINMEETLKGFATRFANPAPANGIAHDLFRSASEICSIHLVPNDVGAAYNSMEAYWAAHKLTGDNSRERVYATVYPRLTTKSNTYTVHFRVQTLKKSKNTNPAIWDEKKDAVMSEYRGSQTIERYVDANDPNIPDYADPSKYATADPIDKFYKCRILSSKKFSP